MEQTRTKFSLSKCGAVVGSPLRKRLSSFGPKKFKRSSRFTIKDVPQFNITKSLTNLGHYASFGTYLGQIWDICVIKGGLPLKALSRQRGFHCMKEFVIPALGDFPCHRRRYCHLERRQLPTDKTFVHPNILPRQKTESILLGL